jgi:hypothetical protein
MEGTAEEKLRLSDGLVVVKVSIRNSRIIKGRTFEQFTGEFCHVAGGEGTTRRLESSGFGANGTF